MKHVPVALIERDDAASLPPGGGLALVIMGSLMFWAAMIWIVL